MQNFIFNVLRFLVSLRQFRAQRQRNVNRYEKIINIKYSASASAYLRGTILGMQNTIKTSLSLQILYLEWRSIV